jgi:hypothetical protein
VKKDEVKERPRVGASKPPQLSKPHGKKKNLWRKATTDRAGELETIEL